MLVYHQSTAQLCQRGAHSRRSMHSRYMNENLVCSGGSPGKLFFGGENTLSQRVLLQGADFIPLVPVPSLVQRLQGYTEGTVCTTIFTAFQTSKQVAFPRKHITQSPLPPPAQPASVPRNSLLFTIIKQGPWQHIVMSWECEVINPSRGRMGHRGHNGR